MKVKPLGTSVCHSCCALRLPVLEFLRRLLPPGGPPCPVTSSSAMPARRHFQKYWLSSTTTRGGPLPSLWEQGSRAVLIRLHRHSLEEERLTAHLRPCCAGHSHLPTNQRRLHNCEKATGRRTKPRDVPFIPHHQLKRKAPIITRVVEVTTRPSMKDSTDGQKEQNGPPRRLVVAALFAQINPG